jgi:menaquinone-dependent protoporphyrinogen IX oxidase
MQYVRKYYEEIRRQSGNTKVFGGNYLAHKYVKYRQLAEQVFEPYK